MIYSTNNSLHHQNLVVMFVTLDRPILNCHMKIEMQLEHKLHVMDSSFKTENIWIWEISSCSFE